MQEITGTAVEDGESVEIKIENPKYHEVKQKLVFLRTAKTALEKARGFRVWV